MHNSKKILLCYSIGDDGCSLDKESKAHLFDPFYTTRRDKGGTGLGAHIVYNLVTQRLKGSIELITKQKNGKSFKIIIPNDSRHVDDSTNTGHTSFVYHLIIQPRLFFQLSKGVGKGITHSRIFHFFRLSLLRIFFMLFIALVFSACCLRLNI